MWGLRGLAALVILGLLERPARATDPFEIQVYDGKANEPWQPGLELHLNHVASGLHAAEAPEIATHGQTHFTLEPSLGITPWWELGAYLQTAIVPGAGFEYAGAKLRSKFVTPPKWHEHLRLGANFEISLVPTRFDKDLVGTEIRPIVAWENERFLLAANFNVSTPLAGDGFRRGPEFEPNAMALVKLADALGLGFEYYTGIGPIASPLPLRQQEHYLYEAAHLLAIESFELSIGVGEGLTPASNPVVVKAIVGYEFDTTPGGSATDPSATRAAARSFQGLRGAWRRPPPPAGPLL
jgi:hypothetical protein